jgi:peptidoglycan/xylan/chitin deacetylase (PgdA/CDA1 family)
MSLVTLMYHDVVSGGRWDDSGFPGSAAAHYKLDDTAFAAHLESLRASGVVFADPDAVASGRHDGCLLTFDDGGASASAIGKTLARAGIRGCFFITTARIGTPGFVTAEDLRALRRDGHLIGSHSHTHPANISTLDASALHAEWRRSVDVLEELLGEPVRTASVPGGFLSPSVRRAAEAAGIRTLFTSEPTTHPTRGLSCVLLGRYALLRQSPAAEAAALATGGGGIRWRQWAKWNAKKPLKRWAGPVYRFTRATLLRRRSDAIAEDRPSSARDSAEPPRE